MLSVKRIGGGGSGAAGAAAMADYYEGEMGRRAGPFRNCELRGGRPLVS